MPPPTVLMGDGSGALKDAPKMCSHYNEGTRNLVQIPLTTSPILTMCGCVCVGGGGAIMADPSGLVWLVCKLP